MEREDAHPAGIQEGYEAALWWMMEQLGITESIERKVIAAVLLQFLATVSIFLSPFLFSGTLWYVVAGLLFIGAITAMVNTVLIVRSDFTGPITELEAVADEIAASADDAAATARQATTRSNEGRDAAEEAIAELDQLEARITETATAVEELAAQITEVDEIVSSQTSPSRIEVHISS